MTFISEVIDWYGNNKRDLPWRNTSDPYIIWLSEVILQQTRVDQGLPYFHRFAERFPSVSAFASANEDEVLKLWQGLGYYSRGRNMHQTAQIVMEEHAGYFPSRYDQLIKLKGIGEYTAAAISSFSANEAKAVVDGNVFRMLSRYFGITDPINTGQAKKKFTELANSLIDPSRAALSNQAIMEFGALLCKPKNPDCGSCPLRPGCEAYKTDMVSVLPVKIKKQAVRERYFNYIVALNNEKVVFSKRGAGDIWQNLYEFPLIEATELISPAELTCLPAFTELFGEKAAVYHSYTPKVHVLSHQKLHSRFFFVSNAGTVLTDRPHWFFTETELLKSFATPKLIFAFLEKFPTLNPHTKI